VRDAANGDPTATVDLTPAGVEQARRLGEAVHDEPLDLCVTTPFLRTRRTADEALGDRDVPRLEVAELGDPGYGVYEGRPLDEYRAWAWAASSGDRPDGGESRMELVTRYAVGFRILLARPETTVLVVCHSLPIAYLLSARDGTPPERRKAMAAHATVHAFDEHELARATAVLEAWTRAPTW
jgi:broad specificity phosphatase PhoE